MALGHKISDLRPPLSNLNALDCTSETEMDQLNHDLADFLEKKVPIPAIYKQQVSRLLETAALGGLTFFG